MCRLAAFPPGTTMQEALAIAKSLEGHNVDGVGTAHLLDGQFIIKKVPTALSAALEKRFDLFNHMPHSGWTIMHTRLATHGGNTDANTHPFEIGDYAFAHNGVWSESELCRFALEGLVKFNGETDSEVAGYFFNKLGPDKFSKSVTRGGVFLGLHRSGELHIVKTYGDLQIISTCDETYIDKPKEALLIASELKHAGIDTDQVKDVDSGIVKMNSDGTVLSISANLKKPWKYDNTYQNYLPYCNQGSRSCTRETVKVLKQEKEVATSANFWSLDPDNYVVEMLGES